MASVGKLVVVLLAGEALFLRGGDDLAVDDQRRGGVVIERRDSQDCAHRLNVSELAFRVIMPFSNKVATVLSLAI